MAKPLPLFVVIASQILMVLWFGFPEDKVQWQSSINKLDSLKGLLKAEEHDTITIQNLLAVSWELLSTGHYDSALLYGQRSLNMLQKASFAKPELVKDRLLAKTHKIIGIVHYYSGNYELALENYFASLEIKQKLDDETGMAACYNNCGIVYWNLGDYQKSLEYYLIALKIRESLNDQAGVAIAYNNIGIIYKELGNLEQALDNYQSALKIHQQTENITGLASAYNNLGLVYLDQKKFDLAHHHFRNALNLQKNLTDKRGIATSYNNLGEVFQFQQNHQEALESFWIAYTIRREIADMQGMASALNNISKSYGENQQPQKGVEYARESLKIARKIGSKTDKKNAYRNLSLLYEKLNDPLNALHYLKLYNQVKDSIYNEESDKNIIRMAARFQSQKKEKELSLQKLELSRQAVILKQKSVQLYAAAAISCLLIILAGLTWYAFNNTRKAHRCLMEQKEQVDQKNMELNQARIVIEANHINLIEVNQKLARQKQEIEDLNSHLEGKVAERTHNLIERNKLLETYASFTSHQLRAPVARILGLIFLLKNHNLSELEKDDLYQNVITSGHDLDEVIHQMQELISSTYSNQEN
ncbi:MAG: tetratricopeptide repeat protein [Candidatus Cyclobacteriaceae bacterium M3_2C_046]